MDEMTGEGDLKTLVAEYLHHLNLPSALLNKIVSRFISIEYNLILCSYDKIFVAEDERNIFTIAL